MRSAEVTSPDHGASILVTQRRDPHPDAGTDALARTTLHASCVAIEDRAVLILGPSGAGKSALALRLMALGARLVADDQTIVTRLSGDLVATCPPPLRGLIEARGLGILRADPVAEARVVLAVNLEQDETERLPPRRSLDVLGQEVALVLRSQNDHFPEAVLLYLTGGRAA